MLDLEYGRKANLFTDQYRPYEALATDTSTWEPRLHFHVGRGEHGVVRSEMVVPDASVRAETMKSLVNYIHIDHWENPPVLKPPIFLPPEHLRQHLVMRSQLVWEKESEVPRRSIGHLLAGLFDTGEHAIHKKIDTLPREPISQPLHGDEPFTLPPISSFV